MKGGDNIIYVTIDLEVADRILPSYCCISVITWNNGDIMDVYSSYIYPDCIIEEYFKNRHGITNKDVQRAPIMVNVWREVSEVIKDKLVFFVNGAKDVAMLQQRLAVDYLSIPNFEYASVMSVVKRTWDNIEKLNLVAVTDALKINTKHYNSLDDAISLGLIVQKSMEINNVNDPVELFNKIGFAGGYLIGDKRFVYRAIKDKKSNEYYKKIAT